MSDFSRLMEIALAADPPKAQAALGPPEARTSLAEQLAANEANPARPPEVPEHPGHADQPREAEKPSEQSRRK